jgi:hypothetical protein
VPFQACRPDPHHNQPELRPAAVEELEVVDRALGRQVIDRDAELFCQNLCERFAIYVIRPSRRSRRQRERLRPFRAGSRGIGRYCNGEQGRDDAEKRSILPDPHRAIFLIEKVRYCYLRLRVGKLNAASPHCRLLAQTILSGRP